MNEQYLTDLHSHLGITDDFNTWISAIKDNDEYLQGLHGHLGITDDFETWKSSVLGKAVGPQTDATVGPVDLPEVTVSASEDGSSGSQEKDTWIERTLGKNVATDFFGDLYRAGKQGIAQGATVNEAFDIYKKGKDISDSDLERFININKKLEEQGASDEMREYERIKNEAGGGVWGFMKGMIQTRGQVIPQVIVSSAAAMASTFFDSEEAAALAGTGAASGAALGAVATPIGAATGAIGGAIAGLTGSMETALTLSELLKEKLDGKEFNKENVRAILEDEEKFNDIKRKALQRGATIGAIEGITAGLSRGVAAKMFKSGKGVQQIARKTTAIEMAGGSGGEALGQVAAGQEFDIAEVLMEGVAEAKGVVNVADILTAKEYKINNGKVNKKEILDIVNDPNTTSEQLAKINFDIKGDRNLKALVDEKQRRAVIDTQLVDARIGDEKDRSKLVDLELELLRLKGNDSTVGKLQKAEVVNRIKEITEQYQPGGKKFVDARSAEVKARKKAKETVAKARRDMSVSKTIAFAETEGKKIGKETIVVENNEQAQAAYDKIAKETGLKAKDVTNADGFIVGDSIIINKDIAGKTGAINVGAHEVLHGILAKHMQSLDTTGKKKLISSFKNVLSKKQLATVTKRLEDNYKDEIKSNPDFMDTTDEWFTAFSDAIEKNEISFDEGVFDKIKNLIQEVVRVFSKDSYKKEFENGRAAYNFLKDYSKSIKKNKLSSRALALAGEGTAVTDTKMSKTASDNVQRIYQEQGEAGAMDIIDQFKPIVNKIVDKRKDAPNFDRQLLTDEIETGKRGIFDLIREYNPDSGVPLAAYINKFLPARAIEASRRVLSEEFTEDVTEARGVTAEDVTVETKEEPKKTKTRKLKELSDLNLENKDIISNNTFKKIQNIIELNPKNIEEQINNLIKKDVAKEIKKEMGKISKKGKDVVISPEYDSFLSLGFDDIVNSLDVNTIKKKYGKLFKIKKKAREKDKKVDPLTGKVTYPGKGIYDITMPKKAEFIKYFTQGGYTTLLERQKVLSELIADSYTKKGAQKYIAKNAKDIDTAIKAEVERWIDSREKQKNEDKSFDNVLYSKSLRNLSREEEIAFWNGLGEASTIMNPALKNLLDSKVVKDILKQVYGDQIRDKNLTAIAKDIVKLLEKYQPAISKNKTIDETTWSEFVANSFMEEANNVIKVLNLEIDGKPVKSAASLYDNIKNIEQGRRVFVDIGNTLLKKYGPKKAARQIAILKGMYANNAKVGRGMFKTDMKTLKVVPVKLKKGKKFGSPRNQIFESVPVFNAYINKIEGKNEAETKAFQEAYKNVKPLFNQDSKSAIKDKDYKGRLKEAQEAREIIDDVMSILDNDLDIAMFMISNLSSMKTPLRRAANLKYIADNVLSMDPKKVGKLAEYEHMIPANYMALKIIDAYKNKGSIKNLDDFYKNYNVAIIPKTMDNVLKQQGLQSKMLAGYNFDNDPSWTRYYNFLTDGVDGIVPIRDINNNKLVGIKFSKSINNHKILNNAVKFSRSSKNPTKGITILDFDDTLATTKSGVRATIPNPDGTPKPNRKVIFLAGGAGSGKSNVVKQLGLEDQGFKVVNQDISLEWLKKNSGLPADMRDLTKEQKSTLGKLQAEARRIAKRKMMKFKGQGGGVVVDGTGGSVKAMTKLVDEFKEKGYDVSMLFVDTSLEVALERNKARKERSLLDKIVEKNHEAVQGNKSDFKEMFGNRFMEVNTDNLKQKDPMPVGLVNKMNDFVSGYEKRRLDAEEFALEGADLLAEGAKFDFSEFNVVMEGQTAPLFNKALKLQKKFGNKDMFVLTARPAESAPHIFEFLKANGLNIPLKNITGLANSTSEAKALWIADKVGEGYNDFYFADDALQNVQAVQNMLDQFDVKSKVQQAKVKFSKSMNKDFNDILENVTGIESKKRFSAIKARKRGESKGKFRFFIPPSHEDFVGLLYNFMGKGKEGNKHRDFFEQALIRPLNRAYRELNAAKQAIANDYKSLNKTFSEVKKKLIKKTPDGDFTYQDAIRVYLWDKHDHDIPGLSPTDRQNLVDLVMNDTELQNYAEILNTISKQDKYVAPTESWEGGDIRTDLDDATGRIGRKEFFTEFNENTDIIFSQENLNKIEAAYGADVVSAIKDMLYRIQTGQNRPSGQNALVNKFLNYLNGSVASTMFFNIRSAVLQQMSMVNFINFADNNIIAAAKAFANQKQYWTDWATIFNSDFMKQRRKGIQTDVNGAELAASVKNAKNPIQAAIKKLLELGFLPTQIGDNIAIATGGATFLRNRINTYLKQGLSQKEAEAKAFVDFEILAEATQQSARPDMVSQQQASPLGKVILAFQNVTSQFNRLGKKAFLDIKNRRITPGNQTQLQSDMSNLSRIAYYFAIQNLVFYSLQSALFMMMFDDNEEDEKFLKKKERMINGSIDSVLRGSGVWGSAIATLKNMAIKWHEQRDKKYNPDESAVLMEMLNVSPPLGIKARKLVNAEKTLNYNKKVIDEMETFDIDNPQWSAVTNYIEATTNVPLNRLYNKTQNVRESLNNQHGAFERALMFGGWSKWNLGIEDVKKEKKKQKFGGKKKMKIIRR